MVHPTWWTFFRKTTYSVNTFDRCYVKFPSTVGSVLDTGAGPNLIYKDLLLAAWKEAIRAITLLQLQLTSREVLETEVVVPLFIRTGDLRVRTRFRIVEDLNVSVLLGAPTFHDHTSLMDIGSGNPL